MKRSVTLVAVVLITLTTGSVLQPGRAFAQRMHAVAPSYYLALGDALSLSPVGTSPSGRRQCVAGFGRSGFVCPLWKSLRGSTPSLLMANLALDAAPAEDSCSFRLVASCSSTNGTSYGPGSQAVRENLLTADNLPYDPARTSQLSAAERFSDAHPGQVRVISLEIGGADLQEMAAAGPMSPAAEEAWAGRLSESYAAIVTSLQQAAPDARLILIDAIDPFAPLTRSHDQVVRTIAIHMAPFYAAFARVVATEAPTVGGIHARVWQAFRAGSARTLTPERHRCAHRRRVPALRGRNLARIHVLQRVSSTLLAACESRSASYLAATGELLSVALPSAITLVENPVHRRLGK